MPGLPVAKAEKEPASNSSLKTGEIHTQGDDAVCKKGNTPSTRLKRTTKINGTAYYSENAATTAV